MLPTSKHNCQQNGDITDFWIIFDNSTETPSIIAYEELGRMASRAEEALNKAVAETIADHKRTGDPIVVWRGGRVVKIPAEQIEIREPGAEYEALVIFENRMLKC